MVPFRRTPDEADEVIAALAENGLRYGDNRLKLYVMVEIASSVILAERLVRDDGAVGP